MNDNYIPELTQEINDPQAKPEFSPLNAVKGAFSEANMLASLGAYAKDSELTPMEEDDFINGRYNYEEHMPEQYKEDYHFLYAKTTSPRDAEETTRILDKKMSFYRDMSEYPVLSFISGMAGGITSPEQLPLMFMMPTGALLSKGAQARLGLKVYEGAKVGVVAGAAAEAVNASPGRSLEESAFSTLASGVFNGALAGAGHLMGDMSRAVVQVDKDMRTIDSHPILHELGPVKELDGSVPMEVTVKATEEVDRLIKVGEVTPEGRQEAIDMLVTTAIDQSSQLKHPKLYKAAAFMSPVIRLATAPVHSARKLSSQLVTTPLIRKGMTADPSVSLMIRMQGDQLNTAIDKVLGQRYMEYKTATPQQAMKSNEFLEAVSDAMAAGDKHENIHVQDAAKDMRKELKSVEDRLVKTGLIKHKYEGFEDITYKDLESLGLEPDQLNALSNTDERMAKIDELFVSADKADELNPGAANAVRRKIDRLTKELLEERKVDQDLVRELDAKHLETLYENGKLTKHAADPLADPGYLHRRYDVRAINKNPKAFEEFLFNVFRDEFDSVHTKGYIDKQIKEKEAAISKRMKELGDEAPVKSKEEVLKEVGKAQRGAPEHAMLKVQKINGGGVLNPVVEHLGDLTHRMTLGDRQHAGWEFVKEKVNRGLKYLESSYGFEKERLENLRSNAKFNEIPVEELTTKLDDALAVYAKEHAKVPVYNEAQRVARQVAIDIGNKDWDSAIRNLKTLQEHLDTPENWAKYAHEGLKDKVEGPNLKGKTKPEEIAARKERAEKRKQLEAELEEAKAKIKDFSGEEVARIHAELMELSNQRSSKAQMLANDQAELVRLQKLKEEKWADVEADIRREVREIRSKILHQDHRSGFRPKGLESVTLKGRTINVPYEKLKPWLDRDAQRIWGAWAERTLPDLLMAERFGGKDGFAKHVKQVLKDFDEHITKAKTEKEASRISREKSNWARDIQAMEESIHNRYGLSEHPDGLLHKSAQYLRWHNMLTSLGMMTFSAIPDLGSVIARQGANVLRFHKHMWTPSGKGFRTWLSDIGLMSDLQNAHTMERFSVMDSQFSARHKGDMFMRNAIKKFNTATGMNHWNSHLKRFVAGVYSMGIVRDAHRLVNGKLPAKDLARYRAAFLGEKELRLIASLEKPGVPPDVTKWPSALQQRFKAAIFNEADTTIVTPTLGDLPLAASSDVGKIILQFKSFAIASNHKLLLTSIDDMTAQKVIGLMAMVFFGHISNVVKSAIQGRELDTEPESLIKEAISRSGIGALGLEGNAILERMTSGQASVFNMVGLDDGKAITFNQNMSALDLAFGPTAGTINNAKHIATMAAKGEARESDIRALRREMWLNNLWMLNRVFTKIQDQSIERWAK